MPPGALHPGLLKTDGAAWYHALLQPPTPAPACPGACVWGLQAMWSAGCRIPIACVQLSVK